MKTLEQINQEFFNEIDTVNTPEEADMFDTVYINSLEDILQVIGAPDEEYEEQLAAEDRGAPPVKKKFLKRLSDVLFYVVIAFILIATLGFSGRAHDGFSILGYSGFTVLSGSMQSEIPEGSLVITKDVDTGKIKIGDDITFVRDDNATITHRVVDIIEDYPVNGTRGFRTKGLENPEPDSEIVHEGNVIGLVEFSIPELGYTLSYISNHIGILFLILGGVLVATVALGKVLMRRDESSEDGREKAA